LLLGEAKEKFKATLAHRRGLLNSNKVPTLERDPVIDDDEI